MKLESIKLNKDIIKVVPILTYNDLEKDKEIILKENKNKSGIYRWVNKVNDKFYVGSSINLAKRLSNYYSINRLRKIITKGTSLISSAIIKYGYINFKLEILEYCDKESIITREQYYIDNLNPKYNICKIAGSTYGKKHSLETRNKIALALTGKKLSDEHRAKLKGRKHSIGKLIKINLALKLGHKTVIKNTKNNFIKEYNSVREAARSLNISHTYLLDLIKKGKLFKDTFLITKKN